MNGRTFAGGSLPAGFALASVSLLLLAGCAEEPPPGAAQAGVTVENLRPLERHDGKALSEPAMLRAPSPGPSLRP